MPARSRRPPGRPPFEPTEEKRHLVRTLAARGNTREGISAAMQISVPTFKKYFELVYREGLQIGSVRNTNRLDKAADKGSVAAMIWLDKTRFGMIEPIAQPKREIVEQTARSVADGTRWDGLLQ